MKCVFCHVSGLTVSVLLHAVIVLGYVALVSGKQQVIQKETEIELSMFEQVLEPEPNPDPLTEPNPELESEPIREQESEPEQIPKPESDLRPESVSESEPEPEPEPKPEPVAQPDEPMPEPLAESEPQLRPKPVPKPDPQPIQQQAVEEASEEQAIDQAMLDLIALEENQYRHKVVRAIEKNKFFPKRAKRMRKGGDILIEFTLNRDGSLFDLKVLEATGHDSLKEAAKKAIQISAAFPPFPEKSSRESWTFQTRLEYRLR